MAGQITVGGKVLASHSNDTDKLSLSSDVLYTSTNINKPVFCVYNSGVNQTLSPANVDIPVDFSDYYVDDQLAFDFTNNKYVVPSGFGGIYALFGTLMFGGTSNAGQYNYAKIGINGTVITSNSQRCYTSSTALTVNCFLVTNLSAGDELEFYANHNGNVGTAVLHGTDGNTIFGGYRIIGF